jgi:hypothetical protein
VENPRLTKTSNTPRPRPILRNHENMAQPTNSRTPRKRQNRQVCHKPIPLARHPSMDRELCQRVCDLPTKQESHPQNTHPTIPHHYTTQSTTLRTNHNGSGHQPTKEQRLRRNPHHRQPWMLQGRPILTMPHHNHRTPDCPTIPQQCLQMVWLA